MTLQEAEDKINNSKYARLWAEAYNIQGELAKEISIILLVVKTGDIAALQKIQSQFAGCTLQELQAIAKELNLELMVTNQKTSYYRKLFNTCIESVMQEYHQYIKDDPLYQPCATPSKTKPTTT